MTRETTCIYFPRSAAGISDAENPTQRMGPRMPIPAILVSVGPRETTTQKCCATRAARIAIHAGQRAQMEGRNQFSPPLGEKDGENRICEVIGRERVGGGQIPAADQPRLIRRAREAHAARLLRASNARALRARSRMRGISCGGLSRGRSSFPAQARAILRLERASQARRSQGRGCHRPSTGFPARSPALRDRRFARELTATACTYSTRLARASRR
jgi:hypothetical protein